MEWLRKFFLRIDHYPLSYRTLVYVLLCSSTFTLIATAAQLYIEYRRDVSNLHASIEFIKNSYLAPISASVYKIDSEHLKLQLNGALNLTDIVHLTVKEPRRGRIIETSVGDLTARNLMRRDFTISYSDASLQKRNIGTLTVSASLDGIYQRLWSRVLTVLVTNAIKTFLASAGILAIIYWLITRHLNQISNYTESIHPAKQVAPLALKRKPLPPSKADELDRVVSSINALQNRVKEDIARRQTYQERLRQAKQKYRTVADYTYDWEYWVKTDGSLEYVSPSCERMSGYSVQDFKKNPELLGEIIVAEDKGIWAAHNLNREKNLKPGELQLRIRRKDGEIRWIEHVCQPVRDTQGVLLGFRASNRDITERKQAELNALRDRAELTHVSRIATLGELSAALAHELNQPLTAILSNAQAARRFLNEEMMDLDEVKEILDDIINDDKRVADMIRRLRKLMRRKDLEFTSINLNQLIRRFAELFNREAFTKNVPLVLELAEGLPNVQGDEVHLDQVLLNLILNAAEAMETVDRQLKELRIWTVKHDEKSVRVSVRDRGPGFDEALIERIFEAFWSTKPEGMGMGLSICKSIIEAHGGRLWAENNPDQGATVSFTLPISTGNEA